MHHKGKDRRFPRYFASHLSSTFTLCPTALTCCSTSIVRVASLFFQCISATVGGSNVRGQGDHPPAPNLDERKREREIECGSLSFSTMGKLRSVHAVQSVHAVPACANSLNRAGGHPGPFSGKLDPGGPNWPHNPSVFSSTHAVLSVRIPG